MSHCDPHRRVFEAARDRVLDMFPEEDEFLERLRQLVDTYEAAVRAEELARMQKEEVEELIRAWQREYKGRLAHAELRFSEWVQCLRDHDEDESVAAGAMDVCRR